MEHKKSHAYFSKQIITYLGNKRKLLAEIEAEVLKIKKSLGLERLETVDLFSGTGIVARMLKQYSSHLIVNDLESYSKVTNQCYLANQSDFDKDIYDEYYAVIERALKDHRKAGLISNTYAPKDDHDIKPGERVFFTRKNAETIDTIRQVIETIPQAYQPFFLGPLIYQASVHNNTGGVFKGFYKDSQTGIGKFGGNGANALKRIKGDIKLLKPVLSPFEAMVDFYQMDANQLVKELKPVDIIYIDPPYNQHPYGSNYFMLNVIADNKISDQISNVSGIPKDWNRSAYNQKPKALNVFRDLVKDAKAKYLIVSYNSEGFISFDDMHKILSAYGSLTYKEIKYNAYRASRHLHKRSKYVREYIFTLKKN